MYYLMSKCISMYKRILWHSLLNILINNKHWLAFLSIQAAHIFRLSSVRPLHCFLVSFPPAAVGSVTCGHQCSVLAPVQPRCSLLPQLDRGEGRRLHPHQVGAVYRLASMMFYLTIGSTYFVKTRTYVALFCPHELSIIFSGVMCLELCPL